MEFGLNFFPAVDPEAKSAAQYFDETLDLGAEADRLGFTHARIVEHYFHPYGGYSPNPLIYLAALAQRTKRMRLITGALLPVFNNPLKMAGEIAMVDALSHGRLDVGVARAFVPHEFRRFGVSLHESVVRFREGLEQLDLLLTQSNATYAGRFHSFEDTTSLPRPTQQPRPKFYIAATTTPDSFEFAGRSGHALMANPINASIRSFLDLYRDAWRKAGHPGDGEVMMAFHVYCEPDSEAARKTAKSHLDGYLAKLLDSANDWGSMKSADYVGYEKMVEKLRGESMETQIASDAAWIGSPADIRASMDRAFEKYGPYEHASLQVNFGMMPYDKALASMRLFAAEVMPHYSAARTGVASPA